MVEMSYPQYNPHTFQKNKIPKELWSSLSKIIYDTGYLCYHDDAGCNHVINLIVEELHKYRISNDTDSKA